MSRALIPNASARIASGLGFLIFATLSGSTAFAQVSASPPKAIPRQADGHPDLQGVWDADFITQLERPDGVDALGVTPDKVAEIVTKLTHTPKGVYDPDNDYFKPSKLLAVNGALRSSWLVEPADGRLPYTALAKAALDAAEKAFKSGYDNPEERPASERCISSLGHPPLQAISAVIPSQIVQTPEALIVWTEDTDGARIIHLTGASPPDAIRTRAGYSAGRWEGDTLVVETTHFTAHDPGGALLRDSIVLGRGSRITERFSLQSDGDLLYQFTVTDADLYDRPWLAEYTLMRKPDHVYEYACHEGNRGMINILKAARVGRQRPPAPDKPK